MTNNEVATTAIESKLSRLGFSANSLGASVRFFALLCDNPSNFVDIAAGTVAHRLQRWRLLPDRD